LKVALDEKRSDSPRFIDIRTANTQKLIDHRRIVEDEIFFSAGSTVVVNKGDRLLCHLLCHLQRISDGGCTKNKLGLGAVEFSDSLQSPQNIRQMAAEDAAIIVKLIDHDVFQVFEKFNPLGVVR
jgi:hypothetical protein